MNNQREYNRDWKLFFKLSAESPSGLVWSVNKGRVKAGDFVGKAKPIAKYWMVKVNQVNYSVHRIVYQMHHGYIDPLLVLDHLDGNPLNNAINNLQLKSHRSNTQNQGKRGVNSSGVTGVSRTKNQQRDYWTAHWRDENGKSSTKNFNIEKFGEGGAFQAALLVRTTKINELNGLGMGYTVRHGT